MPVSKKKPTTSTSEGSTQPSPSPALPEQEEFREHLRRLAVSAVQVLIEQVMREELEQCIGASWGEMTPHRRGYRNGSYTRDLVTSTCNSPGFVEPRKRNVNTQIKKWVRSTRSLSHFLRADTSHRETRPALLYGRRACRFLWMQGRSLPDNSSLVVNSRFAPYHPRWP